MKRGWLKSLDRLRGHPLLSLITSERGPFRALKMRPVRQVLLLARRASEDASRTSIIPDRTGVDDLRAQAET